MGKEQSCRRILVFLVAAWILYTCYGIMRKDSGGRSVGESLLVGKIGPIHTRKMNNQEIRERLGRSTWTLLHTMGATYPASPTPQHKKDTLNFIYLLSSLFPCGDCAQHFQKLLSDFPPRVASHDDFKTWLCEAHNIVNRRLHKPVVDCATVDELWQCGCEK